MQSPLGEHQKSGPSPPCALWPVDLKLTHLDWNPEETLIHFQGQYRIIYELDYSILQNEIQQTPKTKAAVNIGDFCLVEDLNSAHWYRGRVQSYKEDVFDVYLIDHGNVLSVNISNISSCSNDFFILPPKIVCGFLANVLLLQSCSSSVLEDYFSNQIGKNITGYIQALLPHKVMLVEAPDINSDLVRHGFGRHVDTSTFLLLVEMLLEMPLKQNVEPVPDLLMENPRGQEFSYKPCVLQGHKDILSFCGLRFRYGMRAKVRVTAAVNPGLFYCQMASNKTDLREMSKKLGAACEYKLTEHNRNTPENLGLLCSVKGKDGRWYRGLVQFLPVNSQVRVLFIDYGFFESVKVEHIQRLPLLFESTPIMAFPCSINGDQEEADRAQQLIFLKAGLLGRVLDVEIRDFNEEQHLHSIRVICDEGYHVKQPEPTQEVLPQIEAKPEFERSEFLTQSGSFNYEMIMGEALGKTLEAEELQVGSIFVGYVEHVQNPNHFWIRTQKRNDDFEEMMKNITDHFRQVELDEDVLVNPERGTLCCAVHEGDMHFYRAVVTDILEHGAEVLFMDFGNIEKVPHMVIKKMPKIFNSKPAFAVCCSLVNVFPVDEVWNVGNCDFFRRAVSKKALLVHVVQIRKNKVMVDLHEFGSDGNQRITELLISSEQAEYWDTIPIKSVGQNDTVVTRKTSYSVTSGINQNTGKAEDWQEEEDNCKKKTEMSEAPFCFKALCIKPGFEFTVFCSDINSPSDFWCQPKNAVPAFVELMDKIHRYYSIHTLALQSDDSCCVAKSPQDGRWYRALITEKERGHSKVMLVDYGRTVRVKDHNLQAILPEYVHLEGQAFRCSLYDQIEPTDTQDSETLSALACTLFKNFVREGTSALKCKVFSKLNVKNKGLYHVVDLYNTKTQQSIKTLLLQNGLVRETTVSTKQLPIACLESFVFSAYDLSPGSDEQVYVSHISNEWVVYCHLERNIVIIEELEKKISEEWDKMVQCGSRDVVKKMCLAKYFDGKWYRGLAYPVPSPSHLGVLFVDYGNTSVSEKTSVRFIPGHCVDLLHTPMQAMKFNLASVSKEGLYAGVKEWLSDAILNKLVRAVIVGRAKDGAFDVELFDGNISINEKVKELIVSLSPKPKPVQRYGINNTQTELKSNPSRNANKSQPREKSPKSPRSAGVRGNQVGTAVCLKKENTNTSIKCKSQPRRQSPRSSTSDGVRGNQVGTAACLKNTNTHLSGKPQNNNVKVEQQTDNKTKSSVSTKPKEIPQLKQKREFCDTNQNSKQPQRTEIPQLSCLSNTKVTKGDRALCFVSHVDSVNNFFLHLFEDESAILKMVTEINSGTFTDSIKTPTSLIIDDLVLAEYEEDGALYRSVVKDYQGSSSFIVEFVDYGNSAVVGKEKIYSLPKELLSQHRFSIPCSLFDASTYKKDTLFTDAVMEKPLMVDFVQQHGTYWDVQIEILNGKVAPQAPLEVTVDSSTEREKEETAAACSSDIEESVGSPDPRSYLRKELRKEDTTTAERTVPTPSVDCKNLPNLTAATLNPKTTTPSPKLKLKVKSYHRRFHFRSRICSKTNKLPLKAKKDSPDKIEWFTIQAQETEISKVLMVLSNGSFYVRLNRINKLFPALRSRIADNLYKCEMAAEADVRQGLKCLVQVGEDKRWHRAVVQSVCEGKCQVLLEDHGITAETSSNLLRRQCSALIKLPSFAVLCKVNGLGFNEGESADRLWWETLRTQIDKEVKLLFVCYSATDHLWKVEIIMNGLFLIHQTPTLLQQNEELILSTAENLNEEVRGSDLDTSQPQHFVFAPIEVNQPCSGCAVAVTTPFEFCAVLHNSLFVMNQVSEMLDNLSTQIPSLPEAHLTVGTGCLFKSDSKKMWCRAEIVQCDTTATLNLVDYGCYENIPYENCFHLKRLPAAIMDLPKVIHRCALRGLKPIRGDRRWTDEAVVFFEQCLYQRQLQILFREFVSNTRWEVDILADDVHVAKLLVDAGHASYTDSMLGVRFEEQSKAAPPHRHGAEEDCDQEDEASDGKSDISVESSDEAAVNMPHRDGSRHNNCSLM